MRVIDGGEETLAAVASSRSKLGHSSSTVMDHSDYVEEEQQSRTSLPQQHQQGPASLRQQRSDRPQQRQRSFRGGRRHRDQDAAAAAGPHPQIGMAASAVAMSAGPVAMHPQEGPTESEATAAAAAYGAQHAAYPAHHPPAAPQHYPAATAAAAAPPPHRGPPYGMPPPPPPPQQQYHSPHHARRQSQQHQPYSGQHFHHPPPPAQQPQLQHQQQQHVRATQQQQHQPPPQMYHPQQMAMGGPQYMPPPPPQPYIQPTIGRLPADRPIVKLSVSLIDTYKRINKVYYEEREERRKRRAEEKGRQGAGVNNHGWDDENYDYILASGERFNERYVIRERIGKGSFGQVVRALDTETNKDVAIKIIKSKKPFLIQAKTEIELLAHLTEKDTDDQNNIVRLLAHFMYRNHQCLVFEMLSLNLYELLKNTQFGGVSLNLIRKFAKQILKALSFLARPDVDIIHCDLKPENILLRHPKRSGVKVIDFGSSCKSNKRMYSYIQSRFYRSPEVMLGLPYSVAIDMWSLGCILVEMHTGEPLFSGSDQFDQMQKIVKILGMVPNEMLEQSGDQHRLQFFDRSRTASGRNTWVLRQTNPSASSSSQQRDQKESIIPSADPITSLAEVITSSDASRKKKYPPTEPGHSARNYEMFVDLIHKMLTFRPEDRMKPLEALEHPFIVSGEHTHSTSGHQSSGSRRQQQHSLSGHHGETAGGQPYPSAAAGQQRPADVSMVQREPPGQYPSEVTMQRQSRADPPVEQQYQQSITRRQPGGHYAPSGQHSADAPMYQDSQQRER